MDRLPLDCEIWLYLWFCWPQWIVILLASALGFLIRIIVSKGLRNSWSMRAVRLGFDTGLLLFVALVFESVHADHVDAGTWEYWQHLHPVKFVLPSQSWYCELMTVKHFMDLIPGVVLLPSIAVGLALYSNGRHKNTSTTNG